MNKPQYELSDEELSKDMKNYRKDNPQDPYFNYYVPGWNSPDYEIGSWILQGK